MSAFRISLSLRYFFNDERSQVYLLIDDRFSTVQDLELYIKTTFALNDDIYLTCNRHFLPSSERIQVLAPGDEIE